MFFLIRAAFWLSIVIILLPTGSQQPKSSAIETSEAVSAASAAVSDMSQFCSRQPDACVVGTQAAVAFGYKAQAGAKMLYDFLTDALAPAETGSVTPVSTSRRHVDAKSKDTLRPADLAPAWRGPMPRPDPRNKNSV